MGQFTAYIEQLKQGQQVSCRPRGNSMTPRIRSGDLCHIEPITENMVIEAGDVVLCKVKGKEYLHLVSAVRHGGLLQISNNHGHVNGWIGPKQVFGRLVHVEP